MRALIVYESMFGSTEQVARAIAEGLSPHARTRVVEVSAAPTVVGPGEDLLLVGGPTHAFSMTRPQTRRSASEQAGPAGLVSTGDGIREWLATVRIEDHVATAAFDTRIRTKMPTGSAAGPAQRRLRRLGGRPVAAAEGFYVLGTTGPLQDGELDRARAWGARLAGSAVPA
jgi:hypothetical protein